MLRLALAFTALAFTALTATSAEAQAEFQLRLGADVRPLLAVNTDTGDALTLGDIGWVGIDIAPGIRLAKIFSAEVAFTPLIPLNGPAEFQFLIAPGILVDLWIAYARAAIPINISANSSVFFEGAVGISFLSSGYIGLVVDYDTNGLFLLGAEAGWKVSF